MSVSEEQLLNGKQTLVKRWADGAAWRSYFGLPHIPLVVDKTKCSLRAICTDYIILGALEKISETKREILNAAQITTREKLRTQVAQVCDTPDYKFCKTYERLMK